VAEPQPEPESPISKSPEASHWDRFSDLFHDEPGFARPPGEIPCPLCGQVNPENHRYCGFCGVPLHSPLLSPRTEDAAPDFSPPSSDDLQFLRNRTEDTSSEPDGRGWLYLVIGIAVLLAGFFAFERYYEPPEPRAATTPPETAGEPAKLTPVAAAVSSPEPELNHSTATPLPATNSPAAPDSSTTAARAVIPAARISPTNVALDGGAQELAQGLRFLAPTNPARNPGTAAEWLWKAVGKGNLAAEVALADLYLRGEGVGRSCEQARLLLRTAAGKGSGEAATKLQTLACK